MTNLKPDFVGLTNSQAKQLQEQYGKNELSSQKKNSFIKKLIGILKEPMFLLLITTAIIYFILGEPGDGAVMLVFVGAVISIDVIQEWKTDRTINALKDLSAPRVTVIREGREQTILSSDLVPGDLMIICEGVKIPADGTILKCNDLCVNESTLTGEVEGVWKCPNMAKQGWEEEEYWKKDTCYAGTLVVQGSAIIRVSAIGNATEYGKIGTHVAGIKEVPSPLQYQTRALVKLCALIAVIMLLLVCFFTFFNLSHYPLMERLIESVLSGITLAMALIPEEFPLVLTVFLSMGAWRLAKKKSLVRKLSAVETLGEVSVLCVDKTGTITMNQMTVISLWSVNEDTEDLCEVMGLACETDAYDPMEQAMLSYCEEIGMTKDCLFQGEFMKEYAFTNEQRMMGHVWRRNEGIRIAAKGSPESICALCKLSALEEEAVTRTMNTMSEKGLRVIAVATAVIENGEAIPTTLSSCKLTISGLVGLSDPPRVGVQQDIARCKQAGIRVVMITGDNGATASAIARQIGMDNCDHIITGAMLEQMTDQELQERVKDVSIFSRVIPEHKLRIVRAFKENGDVVAMTGDGVNDAPALKYSDIGIAMGKRGSQVSREAADLILMDDNFSTIVETVKNGRRIYDNIRKAIGYIITIHIPIACSSLLAPLLGISPEALFILPLEVVLLELLIDPTCSVVLERQPAESNIMERGPRNPKEQIVSRGILIKSILQGILIFMASFGAYYVILDGSTANAPVARSMGLTILLLSNLFLVQVNSSERELAWHSIKKIFKDKVMWAVHIVTIFMLTMILYSPMHGFLKLSPIPMCNMLLAIGIAFVTVYWYEIIKLLRRHK